MGAIINGTVPVHPPPAIQRGGRPRVSVDVGEAVRLRRQGRSYVEIGRALGVSRMTVYRLLRVTKPPRA